MWVCVCVGGGGYTIALIYDSPDFNIDLVYQSTDHPMSDEVVRILRGMSGELSLFGDVLILGDSTSAYCVDRRSELGRRDLREKAKAECGINFYFESWSGATPRAFLNQAAKAAWRGCSYDWAILLGGWNSRGIDIGEIATIFPDLFVYRNENLIRK